MFCWALGKGCEVLAKHDGEPVLVRGGSFSGGGGNVLVATFHPEMTSDLSIYEMFFRGF